MSFFGKINFDTVRNMLAIRQSGASTLYLPAIDTRTPIQNLIINGNMDFWQRGTSFPAITNATAHADRFRYIKAGTMVYTIAQSSDVPSQTQSGFQSAFSMLATVTTAEAVLGSGDWSSIRHKLEGLDYQQVHGKKVRLQFWVKSSVTGTYTVYLSNNAQNRSYVATYTVNAASTWEKKAIDIQLDSAGTWSFDASTGLIIDHILSAGTTYQTSTLNAWQSALVNSTAGAVNHAATNGNTFQLSQVALIPGDFTATPNIDIPFQRAGRTIQQELAMCQRYFEMSYRQGFFLGTGNPDLVLANTGPAGTSRRSAKVSFSATKRTSPTITIADANSAITGKVSEILVNDNVSVSSVSFSALYVQETGFSLSHTLTNASSSGIQFGWYADAEL